MKLSGWITIILMVGLVFASIGSIVNDFETEYPEIDVNTSWATDFNYVDEINESVAPLQEKLALITSEDEGWFTKISAGITAIPRVLVFVPSVIFTTMGYGLTIFTQVSSDMGVPSFVVLFATTAIIVIIIFKLISWFQTRSREV